MADYKLCPTQPDREFVRRPTEQLMPLGLCPGQVGSGERQLSLGRPGADFFGQGIPGLGEL